MLVSFQGTRASCAGQATPQKANVQKDWKGLAGNWRRRDMTKSGLAYVVWDARRTVSRRANVGGETVAKLWKVQTPACVKNPVLKLSVRENVFGSQPAPNPVTRQLPRNHLTFPAKGDVSGTQRVQVGQTGRSSRWSNVHPGRMGKPYTGRRARDIAVQNGNTYEGDRPYG